MSLSGDMLVMRNGRSTSEVSIYNYPEHLNPFYEEDQHKRLRFWQINKGNQGRRNSFSISNLKDMWAFKSFRMKKKSSTLGINKTSESPPPLRRDFQYGTSADHFNSVGRTSRYADTSLNQFERGVGYRSSLQNVHSNQDRGFGLNRNDNYRRTLQQGELSNQPRRSSRLSVNTNPFDSDHEDELANGSTIGSTLSISSRTPRKKRKAPAPPVPIHKVADELNETVDSSHQNTELRIDEANDISSLTAEIESFVKTTSSKESPEKEIPIVTNGKASNGHIGNGSVVVVNGAIPKQSKTEVTNIHVVSTKIPPESKEVLFINETKEVKKSNLDAVNSSNKVPQVLIIQETEVKKTNVEISPPVLLTKETEITKTQREETIEKQQEIKHNEASQKAPILVVKQTETKTTIVDSKEEKKSNLTAQEPEILIVKHSEIKKSNSKEASSIAAQKLSDASRMLIIEESKASNARPKPMPREQKQVVQASNRQTPPPPPRQTIDNEKLHISSPIEAQAKEADVGHVECIHVHVESPRGTPKNKENSRMTSFSNNNEIITSKTSFTLTSPPASRRQLNKEEEDPKAFAEANGKKPPIASKPEVKAKQPTTSPHLADIHKPRTNSSAHEAITPIKPPRLPADVSEEEQPKSQAEENPKPLVVDLPEKTTVRFEESSVSKTETNMPASFTSSSSSYSPPVRASTSRALHDEFDALYRMRTTSNMEWKTSSLAPLEPHVPKEKRKSVKDIIESINRNQRLLKPGVPPGSESIPNFGVEEPPPSYQSTTTTTTTTSSSSASTITSQRKPSLSLEEAQNEIKRMYGEIAIAENAAATPSTSQQQMDNNGGFMKSRITKEVYDYRESSPTSSNLDWNPLPKPKRSKNLNDN